MFRKERRRRIQQQRNKLFFLPLIFATVILVVGTYAWFTFYSSVDSNMAGHVVSWKIDFDGEKDESEEFTVVVDRIYPGMADATNTIKIINSGDTSADISSVIKSVTIFDDTFEIGTKINNVELTADGLKTYLEETYPFKFSIDVPSDSLKPGEEADLVIKVNWDFVTYKKVEEADTYDPYYDYYIVGQDDYEPAKTVNENNFDEKKAALYYSDDKVDTFYGEKAYTWKEKNDKIPCIKLKVDVNAVQHIE